MCGRYALSVPADVIAAVYKVMRTVPYPPRYNLAPTDDGPVIRVDRESGERRLDLLRWGLVPFWSKDPGEGARMINARCETIATKPAFREPFARRRCIVPAEGFYEWEKDGKRRLPWFIHRRDDAPMAFAGLWERWGRGDDRLLTFTILTTRPNDAVAPLHDRMPVMLDANGVDRWLDPDAQTSALEALFEPTPSDAITLHRVDPYVNRAGNEGEQCIAAIDEDDPEPGLWE